MVPLFDAFLTNSVLMLKHLGFNHGVIDLIDFVSGVNMRRANTLWPYPSLVMALMGNCKWY